MAGTKKSAIIDTDDLLQVWRIISKNWYVVVFCLLLAFAVSYFYTYKLSEVYAAKSQILLKNDETYDYQNQLYKGLGYSSYYQDNSNQIRVITSNDIIRKTLSKLKFDVSYYIVGRLKTTEVYNAMPFDVSAQLQDYSLFESPFKFKILSENEFEITYTKGEEQLSQILKFNVPVRTADFVIEITKNGLLNEQTVKSLKGIDYVFKVHDERALIQKYKSSLSVENIENTTILELTVEDGIPSRSVTFLDSLSKVYIDYTAQSQILINKNTLENIDKQLKEVTEILSSIEDDMELYKSGKAVLNLPRQEGEYFDKLIEYDSKKRSLELYLQSLGALEKYIISVADKIDEKLLPPSFYIEPGDDYLRSALTKLYALQMERNDMLFGSTEDNRNINQLDQNVDLLRKNILKYIDNSQKGLINRISDVEQQIASYTGIIKTIPKTQRDLLTIQRKLDVNEKMYVFLLEKRANTIIARAGILPETSIIESAHSMGIVKPNKRKIAYYFMAIGFAVSLLIVFIRMTLFSKIQNIQELKEISNLPILGEIIKSEDAEGDYIVVDKNPKSPNLMKLKSTRKNLKAIPLHKDTLYYARSGSHGATRVYMQPASDGTGIIAGAAMRAVFECAGVRNVLAKSYGSRNPINVVRATMNALQDMRSPDAIAAKRGKTLAELVG